MMADGYVAGPVPRRGLAIASLVLGILSVPTFGCLIVGAVAGVVLGIVALTRANREPQLYGGQGMAIAGIATSALSLLLVIPIGIIAAIAIPSLLRARVSANEAATIGDIRAVISAEAAYQSASGGFYAPPLCLAEPATCLPAYSGPGFLDRELASATVKNGYRRTFHAGPAVPASPGTPGVPAQTGSLEGFAYTAVPVEPGRTGRRGFCGDASGRVCYTPAGTAPALVGGLCDPSCQEL
jgi:type IV pilus assembly protein PilA